MTWEIKTISEKSVCVRVWERERPQGSNRNIQVDWCVCSHTGAIHRVAFNLINGFVWTVVEIDKQQISWLAVVVVLVSLLIFCNQNFHCPNEALKYANKIAKLQWNLGKANATGIVVCATFIEQWSTSCRWYCIGCIQAP